MHQRKLKKRLFQAIDESPLIDESSKKVLKQKLTWRPRLRQDVLDMITSESLSAGVLSLPASEIDWDALLAFIKDLIPIIIELIELFG